MLCLINNLATSRRRSILGFRLCWGFCKGFRLPFATETFPQSSNLWSGDGSSPNSTFNSGGFMGKMSASHRRSKRSASRGRIGARTENRDLISHIPMQRQPENVLNPFSGCLLQLKPLHNSVTRGAATRRQMVHSIAMDLLLKYRRATDAP